MPTESLLQTLIKPPDAQPLPNNSSIPQRSARTTVRPVCDNKNLKLTLTSYTHSKPPPVPEAPTNANSVGDEHANLTIPHEPSSYKEAMASPEAAQWLEVCVYEMDALTKSGTFKWVERPPEWQVVGSQWVFKVKHTLSGEIKKFHA